LKFKNFLPVSVRYGTHEVENRLWAPFIIYTIELDGENGGRHKCSEHSKVFAFLGVLEREGGVKKTK
jgi:hypothetical protein